MKRLVAALITVGLVAVSLPGCAETACSVVVVRAQVEAAPGELSLADLLAPGTCPQWYRRAAQVSLGTVPRAGSVRVVDGSQIRRLILGLDERSMDEAGFGHQRFGDHGKNLVRESLARNDDKRIPERIEVRQRGAFKTCGEIAEFISAADRSASVPEGSRWREGLDCAAARDIPEESVLELLKTTWNARLERREFALRCGRPEDCIPFLVWAGEKNARAGVSPSASRTAEASNANAKDRDRDREIGKDKNKNNNMVRLIKPGQTAMLTWEQAGIRIVLPVTCLEAGGLGQFVRIRFKDATRTMRAEIVGAGMLRASL
jgi:hypothetical protein